jgi:hypothetical protein
VVRVALEVGGGLLLLTAWGITIWLWSRLRQVAHDSETLHHALATHLQIPLRTPHGPSARLPGGQLLHWENLGTGPQEPDPWELPPQESAGEDA